MTAKWFGLIFLILLKGIYHRTAAQTNKDENKTKTTEGLTCNYYKKLKRSLKETRCIKTRGCKLLNRMNMCTSFLFCLNITFLSLSTALQKLQKIRACFPESKISPTWSSNSKRFHLQALNALFFLLEHRWAFEPFVIVACMSLSCPQKDGSQNITCYISGRCF